MKYEKLKTIRNKYENQYEISILYLFRIYFVYISYIFRMFFVLFEIISYSFHIFKGVFRISYFYTTTWLFAIAWCKFEKRHARNSLEFIRNQATSIEDPSGTLRAVQR